MYGENRVKFYSLQAFSWLTISAYSKSLSHDSCKHCEFCAGIYRKAQIVVPDRVPRHVSFVGPCRQSPFQSLIAVRGHLFIRTPWQCARLSRHCGSCRAPPQQRYSLSAGQAKVSTYVSCHDLSSHRKDSGLAVAYSYYSVSNHQHGSRRAKWPACGSENVHSQDE